VRVGARTRRLLWFVALWIASVCAFGAATFVLRAILVPN
jgi:hypothetical protein